MASGRWRVLAAVLAAIPLALPAPPAVAKSRGRGPDLVIAGGKLSGDPFVFYGGSHQPSFSFTAITANHGTERAGPTRTTVYLTHGGKRWRLADRDVPPLAPGGRDRGPAKAIHEPRLPLGGYAVMLCADARQQVAEGSEANNCRQLPDPFYVVTTGWDGSAGGTAAIGPLINSGKIPGDHSLEKWQSTDLDFFFNEYKGDGRFEYEFIRGTFDYQDGGTDAGGCRYSAGAGAKATGGYFVADYSSETYLSIVGMSRFYEIRTSCPPDFSEEFTLEGPHESEALSTPILRPQRTDNQTLPFGVFKVAGSNEDTELAATWNWSLNADKP
jgi:hypothetical protein